MKKFLVALMAALTCFACVACAPANLDKAKEKMVKAGYKVEVSDEAAAELIAGEKAAGMLVAMDSDVDFDDFEFDMDIDMLTAILFESASAAKEYYEAHKGEEEDNQILKRDGKWVYVGTEDAIEDFTELF